MVYRTVHHCEERLAQAFTGRAAELAEAASSLGRLLESEQADVAAEFSVLPRLPIRLLFWDGESGEGYRARVKFLFDSRVLQGIDLEPLVFASELVTDRLLQGLKDEVQAGH